MKKKIGIITLSASDNCGSLLQTYALQTVIEKKYQNNVEVINFTSENSKEVYSIFPKYIFKRPLQFCLRLLKFNKLQIQKKDYQRFRKNRLVLSGKNVNHRTIKMLNEQYDIVITGSDQVWNINMYDFDFSFFLDWVNNSKKVAYAVSLGGNDFSTFNDPEYLKRVLNDFDYLSVREFVGRDVVSNFLNKDQIPVLADPTLLLSKHEWSELIKERYIKEDYIFYYSWAYCDDELNRIVSKYAAKKGLSVYVINASKWINVNPQKYNFKLYKHSGPDVFLNLMRYAKIVFVQSFHGVIFSYILEKQFYFLDEHTDGTLDKRLDYILSLLNMKNRVVRRLEDISQQKICYDVKNEKLNRLIDESYTFLDEVLK